MIKGNESISKTQKRQRRSEVLLGQRYLKNKSLNRDLMSGRSDSTKTSVPLEDLVHLFRSALSLKGSVK